MPREYPYFIDRTVPRNTPRCWRLTYTFETAEPTDCYVRLWPIPAYAWIVDWVNTPYRDVDGRLWLTPYITRWRNYGWALRIASRWLSVRRATVTEIPLADCPFPPPTFADNSEAVPGARGDPIRAVSIPIGTPSS